MKARIFKIKTLKYSMKTKKKFLKETHPDGKNNNNRQKFIKIAKEMVKIRKLQFSSKFKEVKINDF